MQNRRLQDIALLMYKVKNILAPTDVAQLFNLNDSRYSLRNKDFHLPTRFLLRQTLISLLWTFTMEETKQQGQPIT